MTIAEQIITIAMCTLGTMAMRFLPFLVFRQDKPTPKYIQYLGKVLPGAIFGMLIVYCLRSVSVTEYSWGLPELIAGAATVGIHLWKRSMLLSIAAGTVIYMLLRMKSSMSATARSCSIMSATSTTSSAQPCPR